jgi:nitrogen fixation protein FixH
MIDAALRPEPVRSRWIPWAFVGGMLLVVVVNLVLVWFALTTFTGVTVGHAYDRGRTYNYVIEAAARQAALGWQAQVSLQAGQLAVTIRNRDGQGVAGVLDGQLQRPLEGAVMPLRFSALAAGVFLADVNLPRAGQWDAQLVLLSPGGDRLDIRRRLVVP